MVPRRLTEEEEAELNRQSELDIYDPDQIDVVNDSADQRLAARRAEIQRRLAVSSSLFMYYKL
jgi:hypothetical protein